MNRNRKIVFSLCLFVGIFLQSLTFVKAQVATPDFPTCSNPTGTLKVFYEDGIHGIVGNTFQFSGSDSVYSVDELTLIQCFCSEDGSGIQTNWWKINSLTQDEINTLKNLGWVFVPSGSVWGLDDASYMAKNTDYACGGSTSSSDDNSNNDESSGEVLGTSTSSDQGGEVLGLATTGNVSVLYILLITGLLFIASGKLLGMKLNRSR
ncbi:hypothetical protein KKB40_00555 [Patescibacteria group bacterium]|nr:hypothetical protein [Patescibacteria group bacterium]